MKHIARFWGSMLAKRTLSMVLCLALAVTSGGVCIASANSLVQETKAAKEEGGQTESEPETEAVLEETKKAPQPEKFGEEMLENDETFEEEDTRCLHEFTALWVGYECKLTDYVDGYEPGDEVRITASFNKAVTSQIGLYIDGAWNSFRGEGKKRNITLVPDSDYLNIQISDLKGMSSVNLTEISVEIVRKGEADTGKYLHKFTGLWQGFETRFSDFNPDYEPGDKVRVNVTYSKYVSSQLGMNLNGEWSTLVGDGKSITKDVTPDNDYLNIQITDMWANYKVGIVSISVDILEKGPGVSNYSSGSGRLTPTQYTKPGDYVLFSGEANEKYETNDGWILDCADTDWVTLKYSCIEDHENWGILGWGATVDGEWVDGPGYSADSSDSTKEVTQIFSVKYLRRMMKITPESNVSYVNLGAYSDGRIEELSLHVGTEIPREDSLFKDGAPNQAWVCTDIERILDAPDEKYLCVQYTCAASDFEGWTVLSWGASVDGEWRNGKSYKASYKEATRVHSFSMRMDAFRSMLHLSWDAKVDSIQLSAYNSARILDIWIADEKLEDAGDSKKDKIEKEGKYYSSNNNTYYDVSQKEGTEYPQDIELGPWEWTSGDKSLKNEQDIIDALKEGVYIVVEYEAEGGNEPNLQFTMTDNKQQGVTPTYVSNGTALFSYQDIQDFLSSYLVPWEVKNLQISSGDGNMVIKSIRIVVDDKELKEEPIAVLTKSWATYGTEISKWHSDYEVGDTVKVTVTFDKSASGAIAFDIGGVWNNGGYIKGKTISRTATPDKDHMDIQIGQMPENKSHVKIMDIKVEIAGKRNFNDYVVTEGSRIAGALASSMKETATAILSSEEINKGVKAVIVMENTSCSDAETDQIKNLFGSQADQIQIAKVSDIRVYKENDGERIRVSEIEDPIRIKIPVPNELRKSNYDFAVIRNHNGELTYLEDLDGNSDTVTFASNKFSDFAVVYAEPGVFDQMSGAIKVFRSQWSGWETSFSAYNNKYKSGKPTRITLTFDKDVRAFVDYHKPDWTRVEGTGTGKTFTASITPADDSLTIGIADLDGNGTVKLVNVKVEQETERIKQFTAVNDRFATSFSAFNEMFVEGYPVTVKLTFDKEVAGCIGYHKNGTLEEITESQGTPGKVFTKTFTPGDDNLYVWIADMNGNASVNLTEVEVVQSVTPIYTFTHSWGGEGDTFSGKISDYCSDYETGDKVRITAVLNKMSQVKILTDSGGEGKEITDTGVRVNLITAPAGDGFSIQAGDDSKLPLGILNVIIEIVEKADPDPAEALFTFTQAWGGDNSTYETSFSEHMEDGTLFQPGVETTVTMTFDETVGVKVQSYGGEGIEAEGKDKTVQFTVIPTEDRFSIQVKSVPGGKVNLLSVKAEQKEEPADALFTFTQAWGADNNTYETSFSEHMKGGELFRPGAETTVTLTFDDTVGVKVQSYGGDGIEAEGVNRTVQFQVKPTEDKFSIQVKSVPRGKVNLLSVEVEQKGEPTEALFTFTQAWGADNNTYEASFSEHMKDGMRFRPGAETTVTLTFDETVGVKVQSYGGDGIEAGGTNKTVQFTVAPTEDNFSIQVKSVPNGKVNLLSVEVVQEVESLFTFTQAWGGDNNTYEASFSEHMKDGMRFQPGAETTVTLTFDETVGVKVQSYGGDGIEAEGTNKTVQFTVAPTEDNFSIQVKSVPNGKVNLLSVEAVQEVESLFTFTQAWGGDNNTYEASFSEHMKDGEVFRLGVETTVTLTFDETVGVKVQSYGGDGIEAEGTDKTVQFTVTPTEDRFSIQVKSVPGGKVNLLFAEAEQTGTAFSLDEMIMSEEPIYGFTQPETVILNLADYSDEYENGLGVAVEMNLFSDGNFYAIVEDADHMTGKAKIPDKEKEDGSNVWGAPAATASNATTADVSDEEDIPKATASNATATASNAKAAAKSDTGKKTKQNCEPIVFKSDADGMMTIKWSGNPQSGAIAVTILEMDGTQVNVDCIDVEEKGEPSETGSGEDSKSEEIELILAQEPAKKEESRTEDEDSSQDEPEIPDGKSLRLAEHY